MATKTLTLLEMLSETNQDQKAVVTTDNDLYGTTVIKKDDVLFNDRTNEPIPVTSVLLSSKFKLVSDEKEVSVQEALQAYREGKKVKISHEGDYRHIQLVEHNLPSHLQELVNLLPEGMIEVVSKQVDILTVDEILDAKFYIL